MVEIEDKKVINSLLNIINEDFIKILAIGFKKCFNINALSKS